MAAKNTSMFFMARGPGAHGEPLKSHATDQMVLVISSPSTASKTFGYGMDVLLGASDMYDSGRFVRPIKL